MKRILINASQKEEIRVAMVDGQTLFDLDIEHLGREQKKANIYKGSITRVEPSLEAVFVNYGAERHGFLPFKEIAPQYLGGKSADELDKATIKDLLKEGSEIMVQIDKEERGTKGAAMTTFISLAGCFLVLMPNNPGAGGVSRRIEGAERNALREALKALECPNDMGVIVRTAGVGRDQNELQWDLNVLVSHWSAIKQAYEERKAPFLIHQESDSVIRSVRDYLRKDINEIIIDNETIYEKARLYIQRVKPDFERQVKLYQDNVPLFSRFRIESQIESAFQRTIRLPSGGSIVIDRTEAMVAVDINSSRATQGEDIEQTALNTNLEAADEIARQLRLRDLGGLVVIDFIDMGPSRNQREVENRLKEALKNDRARVQIGRISRFGLLEMSRQRLRPSLGEISQIICPRCHGHGTIRSIQPLALSLIRIIEEEAMKENTGQVQAQMPVDLSTFILNEKRDAIRQIEENQKVSVVIIPNIHMETPQYNIERLRRNESEQVDQLSYEMSTKPEQEYRFEGRQQSKIEEPAVKHVVPAKPQKVGLLKRLFKALFSTPSKPASKTTQKKRSGQQRRHPQRDQQRRGNNKNRSHQQNGRRRSQHQRSNQRRSGSQQNRGQRSGQNQSNRSRNSSNRQPRPNNTQSTERKDPVINTQQQNAQQARNSSEQKPVTPQQQAVSPAQKTTNQQPVTPKKQEPVKPTTAIVGEMLPGGSKSDKEKARS